MSDGPQQEMTLDQWLDRLTPGHRAVKEYEVLKSLPGLVQELRNQISEQAERVSQLEKWHCREIELNDECVRLTEAFQKLAESQDICAGLGCAAFAREILKSDVSRQVVSGPVVGVATGDLGPCLQHQDGARDDCKSCEDMKGKPEPTVQETCEHGNQKVLCSPSICGVPAQTCSECSNQATYEIAYHLTFGLVGGRMETSKSVTPLCGRCFKSERNYMTQQWMLEANRKLKASAQGDSEHLSGCACLSCSMEEEGIPKSMQVSARGDSEMCRHGFIILKSGPSCEACSKEAGCGQ